MCLHTWDVTSNEYCFFAPNVLAHSVVNVLAYHAVNVLAHDAVNALAYNRSMYLHTMR